MNIYDEYELDPESNLLILIRKGNYGNDEKDPKESPKEPLKIHIPASDSKVAGVVGVKRM
jgi:hypothetical protein